MGRGNKEEKVERIKCSYALPPHIFHSLKLFASMQGRDMSAIIEEGLLAVIPADVVDQVAKMTVMHPRLGETPQETRVLRSDAIAEVSEAAVGINPAKLLAHMERVLQEITQDAFVSAVGQRCGKEYKGGGASWRGWRDTLAVGSLPRNYRAIVAALADLGHPFQGAEPDEEEPIQTAPLRSSSRQRASQEFCRALMLLISESEMDNQTLADTVNAANPTEAVFHTPEMAYRWRSGGAMMCEVHTICKAFPEMRNPAAVLRKHGGFFEGDPRVTL